MDAAEIASQIQSFQELLSAGFISQEEFDARKAELEAALPQNQSGRTFQTQVVKDDLTDDMKVYFQLFMGPYKSKTESLHLYFEDSTQKTSDVRNAVSISGDCVVATILCKSTSDASEVEVLRCTLDTMITEYLREAPDMPFCNIKVLAKEENGKSYFVLAAQIVPDIAAIAGGVIDSVVRKVDLQLNFDRSTYAGHILIDLQGSRNIIELSQEMLGVPPYVSEFIQLYDSAETTLRFKSITHLAQSKAIKEEFPPEIRDACLAMVGGKGIEAFIGVFFQALFQELSGDDRDNLKPYLALAFHNFGQLESIKATFGNSSLFTLDVNVPEFFDACADQFKSTAGVN